MPINPNIALSYQAPQQINLMDLYKNALSIKRLNQENALGETQLNEQKTMKDILAKNVVDDGKGGTTLNRQAALSDLYKQNPMKAMDFEKQLRDQDLDVLTKHTAAAKNLAWQATPENWSAVRAKAVELGLPGSDKLPEIYSSSFIGNWQKATLDGSERVKLMQQEKELAQKERQRLDDRESRKELKQMDLDAKRANGDGLPIDEKKFVDTLATKNANKLSIKNQIDATLSGWDSLSDDQKVVAGRQLIKTLNSTEGADAVGVEEANRLGSKLEFAMGNLFNSNPTQFGRDLEGFKEQATNTSSSIGKSIALNKGAIDKAMGRKPTVPRTTDSAPRIEFVGKDKMVKDGVTYRKVDGGWLPDKQFGGR